MKALVTGGGGFIGSHVVGRLLAGYDVTTIDNLSEGRRENVAHLALFCPATSARDLSLLHPNVYGDLV
jgi:nucleoside-diphosphate-sugar epimerase